MACVDCFGGHEHAHGQLKGVEEQLYGYQCYVGRPPPGSAKTSPSQILFIPDAFGLNLVNNKLLVDRYATETGCKVVMPSIIPGGGLPVYMIQMIDTLTTPTAWTDVGAWVHKIWTGVQAAVIAVPFMIRARPAASYSNVLAFARAMKKDVGPGGKLGVAGFCWGGYMSTALCVERATNDPGETRRLIDAQFCAHPSSVTMPMFTDALIVGKIPYSMAIGDVDMGMPHDQVLKLEAEWKQKVGPPVSEAKGDSNVVPWELIVYPQAKHGFSVRATPTTKAAVDAEEAAAKQAVAWFNTYLKPE